MGKHQNKLPGRFLPEVRKEVAITGNKLPLIRSASILKLRLNQGVSHSLMRCDVVLCQWAWFLPLQAPILLATVLEEQGGHRQVHHQDDT